MPIDPADVEVEIVDGFVHDVPFKFFSNISDDRILGFWLGWDDTAEVDHDLVLFLPRVGVLGRRAFEGVLEWLHMNMGKWILS